MFLRYWVPVTPTFTDGDSSLADIGFAYFLAFREIVGREIKIISSVWDEQDKKTPGESIFGVRYTGRWMEHSAYALTVVPRAYVNVVLGDDSVYSQKYREAYGVKNVAIVACRKPVGVVPAGLSAYQQVWAHREEDQTVLAAAGISSHIVPPNLSKIRNALDEL